AERSRGRMAEVTAPTSNGTTGLPVLPPATQQLCLNVADQLEAEADSLALAMSAAVFGEVPAYRAARTPDLERTVLKHSLDHVHAVVHAIRTWTLPSADQLSFVRAQGALRASQQLPLN